MGFLYIFLWYSLRFLLFHFLFCSLGFFLSSSWWFWPESCQICLSKNQLFGLIFFYCFLNLYFIDFLSYLYDFLPPADFRFFGSSLCKSFQWWVKLSIFWDFSLFLRNACITMNFPLNTAFVTSIDFEWMCLHYHLSWSIFKFPSWFPHWPIGFLVACCLVSME